MPHEWRKDFQLLNRKAVSLKSLGSESCFGTTKKKEKDLFPSIFNFNLGVTNIIGSDDDLRWRDGVYNCNISDK